MATGEGPVGADDGEATGRDGDHLIVMEAGIDGRDEERRAAPRDGGRHLHVLRLR